MYYILLADWGNAVKTATLEHETGNSIRYALVFGHLRNVQAFFPDAGGNKGVEGALAEVSQHRLLLALRHTPAALLAARPLPYKHPALAGCGKR